MQPDLIEEAPLSPRVRRDLEIVAASYGAEFWSGSTGRERRFDHLKNLKSNNVKVAQLIPAWSDLRVRYRPAKADEVVVLLRQIILATDRPNKSVADLPKEKENGSIRFAESSPVYLL